MIFAPTIRSVKRPANRSGGKRTERRGKDGLLLAFLRRFCLVFCSVFAPIAAIAQQPAEDFVDAFGIACLDKFNDFASFEDRLLAAGFVAPNKSSLRQRGALEVYIAEGPNRDQNCTSIGPNTDPIAVANAVIAELARRSIQVGELSQRGRRIGFPIGHLGENYRLRVEPSFTINSIVILQRL